MRVGEIMGYEITFIGVEGEKKDADAICFRWEDSSGQTRIGVYDAGFQAHGEAMTSYMNNYYFDDSKNLKSRDEKVIDCLFVSHPHIDHTNGIGEVFKNFHINHLYMNIPWLYKKELKHLYSFDRRHTQDSIERELRHKFSSIEEIEELAKYYGTKIHSAFNGGTNIYGLVILSPSRNLYLAKLAESKKTDRLQKTAECAILEECKYETWDNETLSENVETDAENETSVVVYGNCSGREGDGFMLVGDAGVEGLTTAIKCAERRVIRLSSMIRFLEMPHHGGRHNVTPELLDRLLGKCLKNQYMPAKKIAFVSVGHGSDHPRKVVVNAFIRRGVDVYKTDGNIITYMHDISNNFEGETLDKLEFSRIVEK